MTRADEILDFWFGNSLKRRAGLRAHVARWFGSDARFDRAIAERFGPDIDAARAGACDAWAETAHGRLALIILLDQFSRNVFRGTAQAYACDGRAVRICREGLDAEQDRELAPLERLFFYLPLLHSEERADQDKSVDCFRRLAAECGSAQAREFRRWLRLARRQRRIIALFGRFPHRNGILGRESTVGERNFLRLQRLRARAIDGIKRILRPAA